MKWFDFTLKFSLKNITSNPEDYIEKLGSAGCDDALVGIGKTGHIALDFTREALSAFDAVLSAFNDVKKAIPDAHLVEASPDLVGLTEIASFLGCTRQNIRKQVIKSSGFPTPVHEGNPSVWHLSKVLEWFKKSGKHIIDDTIIDIARANMHFNISKEVMELEARWTPPIPSFPIPLQISRSIHKKIIDRAVQEGVSENQLISTYVAEGLERATAKDCFNQGFNELSEKISSLNTEQMSSPFSWASQLGINYPFHPQGQRLEIISKKQNCDSKSNEVTYLSDVRKQQAGL